MIGREACNDKIHKIFKDDWLGHKWFAGGLFTAIDYQKAFDLDPDYVLTREYLGEALLIKNDLPGAKLQLSEIGKRCGKDCHEYEDLAENIASYVAKLNGPLAN